MAGLDDARGRFAGRPRDYYLRGLRRGPRRLLGLFNALRDQRLGKSSESEAERAEPLKSGDDSAEG